MVSGESRERRGNILSKVPVVLWRIVCKCFVKSSLESNRSPRYFTVLDQGMVTFRSWRGCGSVGRRFVNNMSSVLETFTRSFHLLKYLSSWVVEVACIWTYLELSPGSCSFATDNSSVFVPMYGDSRISNWGYMGIQEYLKIYGHTGISEGMWTCRDK
jgi:hypothetical protein